MGYWFIIVMTVSTLLVLYLGWRLINPLPLGRKRKLTLWFLLALLLFGHRLTWVLHRTNRYELLACDTIDWVGFTFLGFISILVVFMLARDIPGLFGRMASGVKRLFTRRSRRPYFIGPDRARRRFLLNASNGVMMAAVLPMAGFGVYNARRKPSVLKNDIRLEGLPDGLDGFTIAQISDTHIGPDHTGRLGAQGGGRGQRALPGPHRAYRRYGGRGRGRPQGGRAALRRSVRPARGVVLHRQPRVLFRSFRLA